MPTAYVLQFNLKASGMENNLKAITFNASNNEIWTLVQSLWKFYLLALSLYNLQQMYCLSKYLRKSPSKIRGLIWFWFTTNPCQFAANPCQFAANPHQFAATPQWFAANPSQYIANPCQFAASPRHFPANTPVSLLLTLVNLLLTPVSLLPTPVSLLLNPCQFAAKPSQFAAHPLYRRESNLAISSCPVKIIMYSFYLAYCYRLKN